MNDNTKNDNDGKKNDKNKNTVPKAEVVVEAKVVKDDSKPETHWNDHLTSSQHWLRLVFMILFAIIAGLACYIVGAVAILQFLWTLFTGKSNDKLRNFGGSLSQYVYQILRFLTYSSEQKPFPFSDWPEAEIGKKQGK